MIYAFEHIKNFRWFLNISIWYTYNFMLSDSYTFLFNVTAEKFMQVCF